MLKLKLACIFLFAVTLTLAQNWQLKLTSNVYLRTWKLTTKAEQEEKEIGGASVVLYQNGKQIAQTSSNPDGEFTVMVPANGEFYLIVSYPGCNAKRMSINTQNVPDKIANDNFTPSFKITGGFIMVKPYPGIDYSELKQDLIRVEYMPGKRAFDDTKDGTERGLSIVSRVYAAEDELFKRFCGTNKAGDVALAKPDCPLAKKLYNEAIAMIPGEAYPVEQLAKVGNCLKDLEEAEKKAAEAKKQAEEKALAEKTEKERIAKEKAESDRVAKEKELAEKAEKEKLAAEKAEKDKTEKERIAKEKAEKEKLAAEKAEKDKIEKERVAEEKAEAERSAKEKELAEKAEKERIAAEKVEKDKAEKERVAKEKAEAERIAKEKELAEKAEKEKIAAEKVEKDKAEKERVAKEKAEAERRAKEKKAAEKAEKEEAEKLAKEKKKKEQEEAATKPKDKTPEKSDTPETVKHGDTKDSGQPIRYTTPAEENKTDGKKRDSKYSVPQVIGVNKYKESITKGNDHFKMKRYKEALDAFEEALRNKPGDAYATSKIEECKKLSAK